MYGCMHILGVTFHDAISGKNRNVLKTAAVTKLSEIREYYLYKHSLLPSTFCLSSSHFFISDDL